MPDQAQGLRLLADRLRDPLDLDHSAIVSRRPRACTIAVTSGKGGVGKTSFCANFAVMLADAGHGVVLFDADLGLANLHIMLGLSPRHCLEEVMRGERSLPEIFCPGPHGLSLVAGGSDIVDLVDLEPSHYRRFVDDLSNLDRLADFVLIDTGAGLSRNVLAFILAAEDVVVVTTPDPTAIADAYATIKVVSRDHPSARIHLMVNMVAGESEAARVAERLQLVSQQFLKVELNMLGFLPKDPAVARAVRGQMPFCVADPRAPASVAMRRILAHFGSAAPRASGMQAFASRVTRILGLAA